MKFDERAIREWTEANLRRKADEFGLTDWDVVWRETTFDDESTVMDCDALPDYRKARIGVDVAACARKLDDFEDLERVLEHELFHAVSSHTYHAAWKAANRVVEGPAAGLFQEVLIAATERDVRQLESLVAALRGPR